MLPDRKELPRTPYAQPWLPIDVARYSQLYQLVKHAAMDQRLEVVAHVHVRRRLLCQRVDHETQRVLGPGLDHILHITGEAQHLLLTTALHVHEHRHERRIIDLDSDLSTGVTRK